MKLVFDYPENPAYGSRMTTTHTTTTLIVSGCLWSGAKVAGVRYSVDPMKIPANLAAAKVIAGDFENVSKAYVETATVTTKHKRCNLKN